MDANYNKCTIVCLSNTIGRYLLYAITGVEVAVLSGKRLFTRYDFKGDEMALPAEGV